MQGLRDHRPLDGCLRDRLRAPAAARSSCGATRSACSISCCRRSRLIARVLQPLTRALVGLIATLRRERQSGAITSAEASDDEEDEEVAHTFLEAGEHEGLIEREDRALLQSIVDFGDTLVREVMTPRPDIVAIRRMRRSASCERCSASRSIALPGLPGEPRQHRRLRVRQGPDPRRRHVARRARRIAACCGRRISCPRRKRVAGAAEGVPAPAEQSPSSWTSTAAPPASSRSRTCSRRSSARSATSTTSSPSRSWTKATGGSSSAGRWTSTSCADRLDVEIEREGFETVGGFILSALGRVPAVGDGSRSTACTSRCSRPSAAGSTRCGSGSSTARPW